MSLGLKCELTVYCIEAVTVKPELLDEHTPPLSPRTSFDGVSSLDGSERWKAFKNSCGFNTASIFCSVVPDVIDYP